jgi:hypothetical protein
LPAKLVEFEGLLWSAGLTLVIIGPWLLPGLPLRH